MANKVQWNKYVYDRFCELALLSDFEKEVLMTRIKGMSIVEQSIQHHRSVSTINATIRKLKDKYDDVQKLEGSNLPLRRSSDEEKWMDEN